MSKPNSQPHVFNCEVMQSCNDSRMHDCTTEGVHTAGEEALRVNDHRWSGVCRSAVRLCPCGGREFPSRVSCLDFRAGVGKGLPNKLFEVDSKRHTRDIPGLERSIDIRPRQGHAVRRRWCFSRRYSQPRSKRTPAVRRRAPRLGLVACVGEGTAGAQNSGSHCTAKRGEGLPARRRRICRRAHTERRSLQLGTARVPGEVSDGGEAGRYGDST